ncbi:NAD-dependent epimerase/dehydratase family protein [Candidatus Riflebacteria bacterium]
MRIGVTGYGGFIGSAVAAALGEKGHEVVSLSPLVNTHKNPPSTLDMEIPLDLDWIFHFGANTAVQESFKKPLPVYFDNLTSTLFALEIARTNSCPFLFMSSYVYGPPDYLPIDEKHPLKPVNPYAGSKILGEFLCQQFSALFNFPLVILRGFNIYGDFLLPGRLISDLLDCIRKKVPLCINDPEPRRDYLYIKDFISLLHNIISKKPVISGIYNLGSGEVFSNLRVAEIIQELSGTKGSLRIKNTPRKNDIDECRPDLTLVKKTFQWEPEYSLKNGLAEIIASINI